LINYNLGVGLAKKRSRLKNKRYYLEKVRPEKQVNIYFTLTSQLKKVVMGILVIFCSSPKIMITLLAAIYLFT
jgi:hypothetical protein